MAYKRTNWINDETKLNAENMNNIEEGISEAIELGEEAKEIIEVETDTSFSIPYNVLKRVYELMMKGTRVTLKLNYSAPTGNNTFYKSFVVNSPVSIIPTQDPLQKIIILTEYQTQYLYLFNINDDSPAHLIPSKTKFVTSKELNEEFVKNKPITDVDTLPEEGYVGIAVPNSGTITKWYFNDYLSVDEVKTILSQLINEGEETTQYIVTANEDGSNNIMIAVIGDAFGISATINGEETIIFSSSVYNGFNTDITNFNFDVNYVAVNEMEGMLVGDKNDLLSSLISISPFGKQKIKKELLYRTPDTKLHQWGKTIETVIQEGVEVSNTEYVDKIYFNTNLKLEDIIAQLSKLTYIYDDSGIGRYPVFAGTNTNKEIVVVNYSSMGFGYIIGDMSNENSTESVYFISSASFSSTVGAGFVGWNPLYENNYVDIQDTSNVDYVNDINQNELIKNILSTVEIKMDTIEKEDFVEVLTNNSYDILSTTPGGKVGKVIESSENVFIEKIYFDKEMPVDAVIAALVPIENWTDDTAYCIFSNSDRAFVLMIVNYDAIIPGYGMIILAMVNSEQIPLFASSPQMFGFSGWNPDIENNYIEINSYGVGVVEDLSVGAENDKLTSIFSANEDFKTIGISNKLVEFKEKGVPIYPKTNIQNVEGLNTILNSKQNVLTSEYGINVALGTISSAAHISIGHPCVFSKETYEQIKKWLIKGLDVYVGVNGSYFDEEHYYFEVRGQVVEVAGTTDWDYLDYVDHFTVEFIVNGKSYRYKWSSGGVEEFIKTIDSSIENLETLPEKKWTGFPIQAEASRRIEDNNDKLYFNTNLSLEEIYYILKGFGFSSGTTVFLDEKLNSETNEYEIQQNMVIYEDSSKQKVTVEMNNRNLDKLTTTSFSITHTDNNYTLEGTIPDYININNSYINNRKSSGSHRTYEISSFISSKPFNYIAVKNPNMIFRTPDNKLWQYKYDIELTDGEPLSSGTKTVYLNFKQRNVNKLISILEQLTYDFPSTNNVPTASLGNAQYSAVEFRKEENKYTLYNWRTPILYIEKNTNGQWVLSEEKVGTITLTNYLNSQTTSQMNNSQLLRNFISRQEFKETYVETEGFVELPKTPITDVEELPKSGWKGTTVPNNEMVNTIYINNKLSAEEMVNLFRQANVNEEGSFIFSNTDITIGGAVGLYGKDEDEELYFIELVNETTDMYFSALVYWSLTKGYSIELSDGDLPDTFEFNAINTSTNDNSLLSSLFSITPFEKVEPNVDPNYLYRTPDNSIHQVATKQVTHWSGTLVPNSGTVNEVYFNTNLSNEEVNNMLIGLTYESTSFHANPISPLLFSSDGTPVIFAVMNDTYSFEITIATDIANQVFEYVYTFGNENEEDGFKLDKYTIGKTVISEYSGINIGTENSKISSLFSIAPFKSSVEKVKEFKEINKPSVVYISAVSETGTFTNEEIELLKGDNTIIIAETLVPGVGTIGMIFRKGMHYNVPDMRILTYNNASGLLGGFDINTIQIDLSNNTWKQIPSGTIATYRDIKNIYLYDEIQENGEITLRFLDFDGMTHHLGTISVEKQIGSSGNSNALVTHDAVKNYVSQSKITVTENEDGTVDITIPTGEES